MNGGGVFWKNMLPSAASREFLSLRRDQADPDGFQQASRPDMRGLCAPSREELSQFRGADSPLLCAPVDNPTINLSIGGDSMPVVTSNGFENQQARETLLQLKSWAVSPELASGSVMAHQTFLSRGLENNGNEFMSQDTSCKGIKRKRLAPNTELDIEEEPDESGLRLSWSPVSKARGTRECPGQLMHQGSGINAPGSGVNLGLRQDDCSGSSENFSFSYGVAGQEHGTLLRLGQTGQGDLQHQRRFSPSRASSTAVTIGDDVHLGLGPAGGTNSDESCRFETTLDGIPVIDEGSSSARLSKTGGYMPALLMRNRVRSTANVATQSPASGDVPSYSREPSGNDQQTQEVSMSIRASTSGGNTSNSGASGHSERGSKGCKFRGCSKGARGASGLCIAHGGGRRCEKQGCSKGAEGRTVYCKAHGGGRRCQSLGCTKSAEGKTDYCIGHGGGRRCSHESCDKAARGRSGLCIRHGGGKRCMHEGCTKSAEGYSGLCISHGGGRRCHFPECTKGAQGSTLFCKAHGGGKRCMIQGCNKGAEGSTPLCKGHGGGKRCMYDGGGICTKSVHGGTLYCVAHGGGKRCQVEGCSKSARGRTDFCVRHGGGKRCKVENCGKSAQGSTDFCKAHGGGKRCQWGVQNSGFGESGKESCDKFARGKTGLCAAHSAQVADRDRRVHGANGLGPGLTPGLFRGLVPSSSQNRVSSAGASSSIVTGVSGGSSGSAREERTVHGSGMFQSLNFNAANSGSSISTVTNGIAGGGNVPIQQFLPNHSSANTESPNLNGTNSTAFAGPPYNQASLIPPQVLVPLSMQRKDSSTCFQSRPMHGRPPRPRMHQLSDEVGGVCNMGSLSLSEGRVYRGSLPEGRVRGGVETGSSVVNGQLVSEERVHGGGLMALFAADIDKSVDPVPLGTESTRPSVDSRWGFSQNPSCSGSGVTVEDELGFPDRRVHGGLFGSDVGQFLASPVNLNFKG